MSKLNPKSETKLKKFDMETPRLAGGAGMLAAKQDNESLLRRAVMVSLLWEKLAYESGDDNAINIKKLIPLVSAEKVALIALEARQDQKLRHIPLFIAREMARYPDHNKFLGTLLPRIITRADQLTDFVSLYFKDKKQPLTNQIKKGLADSFYNFDEYQFAKYNQDTPIKIRDVMFLVHPKPTNSKQEELFNKIANKKLATPDTWEVALSGGKDKKETFTDLILNRKLGGVAFLRNLRNIRESGVDYRVIQQGFDNLIKSRSILLPLNFYSAYKHNPDLAREIENVMLETYKNISKLPGDTVFVVDASGSMKQPISSKSNYNRFDVACVMAMLASEISERVNIYITAGKDYNLTHTTKKLIPQRGFALIEQLARESSAVGNGGIFTRQCLEYIKEDIKKKIAKPDRIIVFSDSQDCDQKNKTPAPFGRYNYICDVSAHKNGINYKGVWSAEISGWSENFLTFISSFEGLSNNFQNE